MSLENTSPAYIAQTFRDFLKGSAHCGAGYVVREPSLHGNRVQFLIGQTRYGVVISGPLSGNYICNLISKSPDAEQKAIQFSFQVKKGKNRKKAHAESYLELLATIIDKTKT